jgi:hypothetical protein
LVNVFNVYVPPGSSCPPTYKLDLNSLLSFFDSDTVIMGDVNAHHAAWYASSNCSRGDDLVEAIENSALCVINTDTPTHLPSHGDPNSPDVTIISAHLAVSALWTTQISLNSDHLPITVDLEGDSPPGRCAKTFTNFRLADWAGYLDPGRSSQVLLARSSTRGSSARDELRHVDPQDPEVISLNTEISEVICDSSRKA